MVADYYFVSQFFSSSLTLYILQGKKGVWIKVPIELVNLVETAVKVISLYFFGT